MKQRSAEEQRILNLWPDLPEGPLERILHTLDAYRDEPDSMRVLAATYGVYGPGVTTGITLGDLRALETKLRSM